MLMNAEMMYVKQTETKSVQNPKQLTTQVLQYVLQHSLQVEA